MGLLNRIVTSVRRTCAEVAPPADPEDNRCADCGHARREHPRPYGACGGCLRERGINRDLVVCGAFCLTRTGTWER